MANPLSAWIMPRLTGTAKLCISQSLGPPEFCWLCKLELRLEIHTLPTNVALERQSERNYNNESMSLPSSMIWFATTLNDIDSAMRLLPFCGDWVGG